jgi:hypothetical protein
MRASYVLKGCRGVTPPLLVGMVDGRGLSAGAFRCPACCPAIAWKLMRLLNMSNADIFWPPQFIIAACTHTHTADQQTADLILKRDHSQDVTPALACITGCIDITDGAPSK